jgi:hypothetical protein
MEGADMNPATDQLSSNWPTIFELASTIQQIDLHSPSGRRVGGGRNRAVVTKGLTPEPFPLKEGYFSVTPEQIASVRVPRVEVGETIKGFQRDKVNRHARKIARALIDGTELPPLMISIFPDGNAYVDDGQHRALGSVIARRSVEVVVKHRTVDQARQLFANQSRAKKLKSDDTLLTGNSAIELYLQDAVTSDDHPWTQLVTPYAAGRGMTPTSMVVCVGAFVFNTMTLSPTYFTSQDENDFDTRLADKLARLIEVFGVRTTNPLAFRAKSLRAITYSAIHIFRRNPNAKSNDEDRWIRHMPLFDFGTYPHLLNREVELSLALVDHWNKRLPAERKVIPTSLR